MCACVLCVCYVYSGLVYRGLSPQQQPGSYRGGDYDEEEISVSLVEATRAA